MRWDGQPDNLHQPGPLDSLYQYLLSTEFIISGIPGKRAGFEGPIQMDGKVMNQEPCGS